MATSRPAICWPLVLLLGLAAHLGLAQQNGPPKILPIATADSYPEGSSVNLICTVSGGQRKGLTFSWRMNDELLDDSTRLDNVEISTDRRDISVLAIENATSRNTGKYSCTAKNALGEDSTAVQININVEMKWNKTSRDRIEVGVGQELLLECDAVGTPQPIVEWYKHSMNEISAKHRSLNGTDPIAKGKQLKVARTQENDSGLYECLARNGVDANLRKIIQVQVRGK